MSPWNKVKNTAHKTQAKRKHAGTWNTFLLLLCKLSAKCMFTPIWRIQFSHQLTQHGASGASACPVPRGKCREEGVLQVLQARGALSTAASFVSQRPFGISHTRSIPCFLLLLPFLIPQTIKAQWECKCSSLFKIPAEKTVCHPYLWALNGFYQSEVALNHPQAVINTNDST